MSVTAALVLLVLAGLVPLLWLAWPAPGRTASPRDRRRATRRDGDGWTVDIAGEGAGAAPGGLAASGGAAFLAGGGDMGGAGATGGWGGDGGGGDGGGGGGGD